MFAFALQRISPRRGCLQAVPCLLVPPDYYYPILCLFLSGLSNFGYKYPGKYIRLPKRIEVVRQLLLESELWTPHGISLITLKVVLFWSPSSVFLFFFLNLLDF